MFLSYLLFLLILGSCLFSVPAYFLFLLILGSCLSSAAHCEKLVLTGECRCKLDFTGVDVFTTSNDGKSITSMHGYFDTSLPAKQLKPCLGQLAAWHAG